MTGTGRPRSVADLRQLEHEGCCPDFLFFWGHDPGPDGDLGRECLSQWWPASFTVDGVRFPTAEHFMMVGKAKLFGDELIAARILDERAAPRRGAGDRLQAADPTSLVLNGANLTGDDLAGDSSGSWPWCLSPAQRYPAGLRASQTVRLVRTVRSSRAYMVGARASRSAMSLALSLSSRPCRARLRVIMA
jgi:hypothetical protein